MHSGMSAARRTLSTAAAALATLTALAGIVADPSWADQLFTAAAVTAAVTAWLLRAPRNVAWLDGRRTRKQVAELARRMDAQEKAMAEQQALRESSLEGVRRALSAADIPVPDCVAADAPTQPVLRVIGKRAV